MGLTLELEENDKGLYEVNFNKFFRSQSIRKVDKLAQQRFIKDIPDIVVHEDIENGTVGKILGTVALGAVGFLIGGWTGAIIGASLAMSLFWGAGKEPKKEKPRLPTYGFSMSNSDELATQGEPIPIIYCNSVTNDVGGVRWVGKLVSSKVINLGESGVLYQIFALGLGALGGLDNNKLLVDRQSIDRFYPEDLEIELLRGYPTIYANVPPTGFINPEYNFLAQTIAPQTFNQIGVNLRALAKSADLDETQVDIGGWISNNAFLSGSQVRKNSGTEGEPDGVSYTSESISNNGGGSISWRVNTSSTNEVGYGEQGGNTFVYSIKTIVGGAVEVNLAGGIYILDGNLLPIEWSLNDVFKIDLTFDEVNNKVVIFSKNSVPLLTFIHNWYSLSAKVVTYNIGGGVLIENAFGLFFATGVYGVDAIQGANDTMTLVVFEDEKNSIENYSTFTPSELYEARGKEFRVLEKQTNNRNLTCTPYIPVRDEDDIYCKWTAYFQNTRKCTESTFNFSGLFYSRPKPEAKKGGKK